MTNKKDKDKNNGKYNSKSWLGEVLHSHLRRDETAPKMGHPIVCGGLEGD